MTLKTFAFVAACAALFSLPAIGAPAADSSGSFTGTVYDSATHNPIEGALVVLSQYAINPLEIDTFLTGSDGKYDFSNLLTGNRNKYTINVIAGSYANTFVSDLVLIKDQIDTIDFYLVDADSAVTPPGDSGRIIGTVYDTVSEGPISGALVILSQGSGRVIEFVDSTRTDIDGSYSFEDLSLAIRFTVSVTSEGYLPGTSGGTYLYASTPVDTVDFYLVPMDTSNSWLITGTITADSTNGQALENVSVIFTQRYGSENQFSGTTNAQGMYAILIPAQTLGYTVSASLAGYVPVEQNMSVSEDSSSLDIVLTTDTITTIEETVPSFSGKVSLHAFPNPCKQKTMVSFGLAATATVQVAVYSVDGSLVATLAHGTMKPGVYSLQLPMSNAPAGMYFVRAAINGTKVSHRILLIR